MIHLALSILAFLFLAWLVWQLAVVAGWLFLAAWLSAAEWIGVVGQFVRNIKSRN